MLVFGDRGTGKSTAVRALAALLPPMQAVADCRYACDPAESRCWCDECRGAAEGALKSRRRRCLWSTCRSVQPRTGWSALSIWSARCRTAIKAFEPGLLARANRGFLYIDEVNLLEDHLVDLLIDVAASGENLVEREGLSVRHPSRFVLIGSGNPEEGELRPQLLDRFGLSVEVRTPVELKDRVEVIKRRDEFERDRGAFIDEMEDPRRRKLRRRIVAARKRLRDVSTPDEMLECAAKLCMQLGTDGLRSELTLIRAARALASFEPRAGRRVAPEARGALGAAASAAQRPAR